MSKKNKRSYQNKSRNNHVLSTIPAIIVLMIVPLIVRLKVLEVPSKDIVWQSGSTVQLVDLFAYYKGALTIIAAILALFILSNYVLNQDYDFLKTKPLYLLYGYMILVVLSFATSVNHSVSIRGYSEHFENFFILIAYIILTIYTSKAISHQEQFQLLINCWTVSIVIMFLIGLTQFFEHDFFTTSFGTALILPAKYANATASQDTDTVRNVYQTLFHYNYVSFYASIGLPFFLMLSILEANRKRKILFICITLIFAFNQYASLSRNGILGIGIALVVGLFLLRKRLLKRWYLVIPILLAVILPVTAFIATSDNRTAAGIRLAFQQALEQENYPLNSITTHQGQLEIDHDAFQLSVSLDNDVPLGQMPFLFTSQDGNQYKVTASENPFTLKGINAKHLTCAYASTNKSENLRLTINGHNWDFAFIDQNFFYIDELGQYEVLRDIESFGFEGRLRFGSGRGFIWSRTIPLFKEYGLLGSGPDTFALVFPQHDYVGKYIAYTTPSMVVDKPHNLYLNYAVNTGLPSLLALLAFWLYYIFWSLRLYIRSDFTSFYSHIGIASLVAVIGYLSSGLFNDSSLNVTPTFWIIIGLGIAANTLYQKELKA